MIVALVGQPNAGKSTLFNAVAGYQTVTSNFAGTTIELTRSPVNHSGRRFELVEMPGIYSLSSASDEERRSRDSLVGLGPDVIVQVLDASMLSRGLELTLELLEYGFPLVVGLNMMDEAERKGVHIDVAHLQKDLGVPVVPLVATRGSGIPQLFATALDVARHERHGPLIPMSRDVETTISELLQALDPGVADSLRLPSRFLAIKLLEMDEGIEEQVLKASPGVGPDLERLRTALEELHGRPSDVVISSERHALCVNLFEHVAWVGPPPRPSFRDRLDRWALHPWWGYVILLGVLYGFFSLVFGVGHILETPLLGVFTGLSDLLARELAGRPLAYAMANGMVQGLSGGIGIVLPYLVPFLVGLAILEDSGYIPRVAFLMDALMHMVGLHGKSVIPFVLGYGCTVPAIMSARISENPRDRYVTALLVNFIPCAARTTVIFALIGFFMGSGAALAFYALNLVIIAVAGRLLLLVWKEVTPGIILQIPPYRVPEPLPVLRKVWFRMREFVVLAWPILIVGSVVMSLLDYLHLADLLNGLLSPFTAGVLGLPMETGVTLLFGILRKELSIVMLVQALGTTDFSSVLTHGQMVVFTAFTVFYVPCLATLTMLRAVIGWKGMLVTLAFTSVVATLVSVLLRVGFAVLA